MKPFARDPAAPRHGRFRRVLTYALGGVALLALAWQLVVGAWLPGFAQARLEEAASEALGAPLAIESIEIDPWSLRMRVLGAQLGPAQAPWLRVAAVEADVSIESVARLAPVLKRLTVREPQLELERVSQGRYNVTPLIEALARRPAAAPEEDERPARFALNNLSLEGGRVHLVDRVGGGEHRIESLQLGIPFISNLASHVEIDVEPLLDAQVDGSRLQLRGKTLPFSEGLRSSVALDWRELDVARWVEALAPLLPQALPMTVERGQLGLALEIAFERRSAEGAVPLLRVTGAATLAQLQSAMPDRGVQMALREARVEGLELRPLERSATVALVRLQAPVLDIDLPKLAAATPPGGPARASSGAERGSTAASASASSPGPVSAQAQAAEWQWSVANFEVDDGTVRLHEPAWPQPQALAPVRVRLAGLQSRGDAPPAPLALSLTDAQGARAQLEGSLSAAARRASIKLELADWQPLAWLAPWSAQLPVRLLGGRMALQGEAEIDPGGWSVRNGSLQITKLELQPLVLVTPQRAPQPRKAMKRRANAASAGPREAAQRAAAAPVAPRVAARPRAADKRPAAADRLQLAKLELSGVRLDARKGNPLDAQIAAVRLEGLDLEATRGTSGALAWLPAPPDASARRGSASAAPQPGSDGASAAPPAPRWQLDELRCSDCTARLIDTAVKPAASFGLLRSELIVRKLGSDLARPVDFELAAQWLGGGRLRASGNARPQPLSVRSRLDLDALDLRSLQPYIDPQLNVTLTSAKASAAGALEVEGSAKEQLSRARWRGRLALGELRAVDKLNAAEFVRLRRLRLDAADLQWRPAGYQADLGAVVLEDFYGRVIINADGRLNLSDVLKRPGDQPTPSLTTPSVAADAAPRPAEPPSNSAAVPAAAGSAAPIAPAVAAAELPASAAASAPMPLRWRSIRLAGGSIDFTDNFIRPNYSAKLTDIAGDISALAWNEPQPATVNIAGRVDGSAPLEIGGTVHPLGPRLATDITASARGIDVTRLSTYSGRYAGYGIEKGTLSVQLHYKLDNGKLEATNKLYLDQLTFGDKVESPNALKLPVLLAVSLLKDRHGVIDIDLPISGSLDDPQFSIGGIIVRVIVNLIAKAVTAPFTLLAGAFGGARGEELGFVEFAPGSAELEDGSRQRLDTLAKALIERPALRLEATGRADPAIDTASLRGQHVERLMRVAKAKSSGELPESVRIEPAERARWLEAAYKAADLKDKPRNLVGLAKSLPPAEIEKRLSESAPTGDGELRALADQRGDRVKAYLSAKLPPERVLLRASKVGAEGLSDAGKTTRVAFALK